MLDIHRHLEVISKDAGLEVMGQLLSVVADREEIDDTIFLALTVDDIGPLYDAWIGPAVDRIEASLRGDYQ